MSQLWPSQMTSTTRSTKSTYKPTMRTDWTSGVVVMAAILGMVAVAMVMLWPVAAHALDSITTITRTLETTRR